MVCEFQTFEIARRTFDQYARIEPRLTALWRLCRLATPPAPANDEDADPFDADPFEIDVLAADKPTDGWCAEDHFYRHVKPELGRLVGIDRREGPPELCDSRAYDEVYSALFYHALRRPCACCQSRGAARRLRA